MEGLVQRQPQEEEEELLQTKPVDREAAPPDLRRQIEDEDDQVRGKSIDGRILPAACADCEEERVDR